jgi:CHAD domain-containing protein
MPEGQQAKTLKLLKKVRRRAGRIRDLDVQSAALNTINIQREEKLKAQLLDDFRERRRRREKKLVGMLKPKLLAKLRKRLSLVGTSSLRRPNATQAYAALKALQELWAANPTTIEQMHTFRVRCKRVRYAFEQSPQCANPAPYIKELKAMQDALGELQDWSALAETIRKRATSLSPLFAAVRAVAASKTGEARGICASAMNALAELASAKRLPQSAAPILAPKARHAVA